MVYRMDPSQAKLAEKLVLLNDRAKGMLTRLYNIKKVCADPKSRPLFLTDRSLDSAIKHVVKKFPIVDTRSNMSTFNYANSIKDDIIKNLTLYYYTFADLLDLKDHIMQCLTLMDACQCQLDIALNFELTAAYLNMVVTLISLMWLLSRIEDKKAVLGLFNAAYDLSHGQSEPSFPRLGQMILDYDTPFKKLQEDLGPLNRLMLASLQSLSPVYIRRNVTAETWRSYQILSLTANPHQMIFAAQTETIACEYLSLDVMDRWIILCTFVCPTHMLSDPTVLRLWTQAVQMGIALRIFRDEVLMIHPTAQTILENVKGLSKRAAELKELSATAIHDSVVIHMERRRFLRGALRELVILLKEQPGLLGPKILFVWMALSFSRDEVIWLLRHIDVWPQSNKKNAIRAEDLVDRQLPELLHYMLELRDLVAVHGGTISQYYLQYVSNYDAHVAAELLSSLSGQMGETEGVILSDMVRDLSQIDAEISLEGIRLDWIRLQAMWSMGKSSFSLTNNKKLAVIMNTTIFHTKMIDEIRALRNETSDLSIYCFYAKQMDQQWKNCLETPTQCRYALSYARLCGHFPDTLHPLCPEERHHVMEKSLGLCNTILDETAKAAVGIVSRLGEYELRLAEQTTPSQVAANIAQQMARAKAAQNSKNPPPPVEMPAAGEESLRSDRQVVTLPDKLQSNLVELCAGIGSQTMLEVSNHKFCPREYFSLQLENRLFELVLFACGTSQQDGSGPSTPRRPSQLLLIVQSYMAVFQNIDSCLTIDMTRIFQRVLLQQTQPMDIRSRETLTSIYTKWYLEVVLRRASNGLILYSQHMQQMIAAGNDAEVTFAPEQYSDPHELRALAQLLGPYGLKYLSERLAWHVASQIAELSKTVVAHIDLLKRARLHFDDPDQIRDVYDALCKTVKDKEKSTSNAADSMVQRVVIIGEILSFRDSLHSALRDVLSSRLPFLVNSFCNLSSSMPQHELPCLSEMASALGEAVDVDTALSNAVRAQSGQIPHEEHYEISCLLMIGLAVCLPRIAASPLACYRPLLRLSMNNAHCLPVAVSTVASALFFLHGKGDTHLRMREFIAIASSSILRICREDSSRGEGPVLPPILPILLDQIVDHSPYVTHNELDACFPYDLVMTAYRTSYQQELGTH